MLPPSRLLRNCQMLLRFRSGSHLLQERCLPPVQRCCLRSAGNLPPERCPQQAENPPAVPRQSCPELSQNPHRRFRAGHPSHLPQGLLRRELLPVPGTHQSRHLLPVSRELQPLFHRLKQPLPAPALQPELPWFHLQEGFLPQIRRSPRCCPQAGSPPVWSLPQVFLRFQSVLLRLRRQDPVRSPQAPLWTAPRAHTADPPLPHRLPHRLSLQRQRFWMLFRQ